MDLTSKELTRLWKHGKTFSQTALSDFGGDAPNHPEPEEFSDNYLEAHRKLRSALHSGSYIGIGFPNPKRVGDVPMQIPSDAWAPDLSGWQLEIGPGVLDLWPPSEPNFCEVRIAPTAENLTKTGGRPTLKRILKSAMESLAEDGLIEVATKQNAHFEAVRNRALALHPLHKVKIQKASDRTIAKYLSPAFNALKGGSE